MKRLIPLLIAVIAFPLMANAQSRYTPAELDTLVSTIALYPDPLLVHVLNATTHGDDLPNAYAFANANRNLKGDDLAKSIENAELDYDESVMALIPFPDVLKKLTKYATWANQLGEAVEMQKADVMDAVQRMRKVANKNGYLKSDENVTVTVDDNISIQPVREEYVYVPEYDPRIVYYVVSDGTFRLRYANGIWIGAGLVHWGWDPFVYNWVHRRPHYRHPHRPLPRRHARPGLRPRFNNPPPPPPRTSNPPPSGRRPVAPPPPRANSAWDRHSSERLPVPSNVLNKTVEPSTQRSSLEHRSTSAPPPPPPPSNFKRPVPPPPQASSSNDDEQNSRWDNRSRHEERNHGARHLPQPPHRRR